MIETYHWMLTAALISVSIALYLQIIGRDRVSNYYVAAFYFWGTGFATLAVHALPISIGAVDLFVAMVILGKLFVFVGVIRQCHIPGPIALLRPKRPLESQWEDPPIEEND